MFKKLLQSKKAHQTAEYAILIALVVGAVIAMQTYAQRTIQARIRGAATYLSTTGGGNVLGTDLQYEPYYLNQAYTVTRDEDTTESQDDLAGSGNGAISKDMLSNRTRASGGYQTTTWNAEGAW